MRQSNTSCLIGEMNQGKLRRESIARDASNHPQPQPTSLRMSDSRLLEALHFGARRLLDAYVPVDRSTRYHPGSDSGHANLFRPAPCPL